MKLLHHANTTCLRFWRDESGVVLALTAVTFLLLFVMACSVFAIGETIRQRVEIQNAADAGAYSGAIVQADTISRVACINRAMAWTYVQTGRMEMDAIVDKWLETVVNTWRIDYLKARGQAELSTCFTGQYTGWDDWYCGLDYIKREHVYINQRIVVKVTEIIEQRLLAEANGKSYSTLSPKIKNLKEIVGKMNAAEVDLLEQMPTRIHDTVRDVIKRNVIDTMNDQIAGGADFMFALSQEENYRNNFEQLENTAEDEQRFLRYADYNQTPEKVFGRGSDKSEWYIRQNVTGGPGIQRAYQQRGNMLVADWSYWGREWHFIPGDPPPCVPGISVSGQNSVTGEDCRDNTYYVSALCQPWKLSLMFFGRGEGSNAKTGSIIVSVCRRMNNPFYFIFGTEAETGIFRAFTLNNRTRFMWGVAAARAGHKRNWKANQPDQLGDGGYDPTSWNSNDEKLYNLKVTDWDAVFLPLHRTWDLGIDLNWEGSGSGGQVLSAMRGGPWEALYGGGGALGTQGGPLGMNEGAEPNWNGLDGWAVH